MLSNYTTRHLNNIITETINKYVGDEELRQEIIENLETVHRILNQTQFSIAKRMDDNLEDWFQEIKTLDNQVKNALDNFED